MTDNADTLDDRAIAEVFRRRAAQIAVRKVAAARTVPMLVFGLGRERYAIELSELAEVFSYRGCTPVPGAPPALIGVINLRGEIRAIADLGRILELAPGEATEAGYVLMLRHDARAIGYRVDRLEQIRDVDPAQLAPATEGAAPVAGSRFVKALTANTVIVIDAVALLAHLVPPLGERSRGEWHGR